MRLADEYPSRGPPHFELDAVPLSGADREAMTARLNSLYADNAGEPIIYIWVEALREYLSAINVKETKAMADSDTTESTVQYESVSEPEGEGKLYLHSCCRSSS